MPQWTIEPLALEQALELRPNAILYRLGRTFAATPDAYVAEVDDPELNFKDLADEGFLEIEPVSGVHAQLFKRWMGRGQLSTGMGTAACTIRWRGETFIAVTARWALTFNERVRHWVIGRSPALVEEFLSAALDAVHIPRDSVLVYASSCFSRDKELFRAIQESEWSDLIAPAEVTARMRSDVRTFLDSRETYRQYRVPHKRGILLSGPPGNGKTFTVRLLLKEAALPILSVRSFAARYGEEEGNITNVFLRARRLAPCVLVLEDVDSLVKPTCLSVFLNELDGLSGDTGILTIATTNHPERLDPALLERPSRFDRKYHFALPDTAERARYLESWNGRFEPAMRLDSEVVRELADRTEGMSFAFLKELVVSAMVRWMAERQPGAMRGLALAELEALRATWRPIDEGDVPPAPKKREED
ncbi:MAG: ATP-binding protein [Polyangiaceae bacterium]